MVVVSGGSGIVSECKTAGTGVRKDENVLGVFFFLTIGSSKVMTGGFLAYEDGMISIVGWVGYEAMGSKG